MLDKTLPQNDDDAIKHVETVADVTDNSNAKNFQDHFEEKESTE